jgi:hypothetical protein
MIRERALTLTATIALALLLVAIAALMFQWSRHPGFLSPGASECRASFARARTASDSAAIDLRHPSSGPQKDPNAPTCGTLRITGELRQE